MSARGGPPNFDRIAGAYRWLEHLSFGNALQRCRAHYLPRLASRGRALVLGDGDGRFTARLLAANRGLRVVAVDTSAAMLTLLRQRCHRAAPDDSARLCTVRQNAMEHVPSDCCDLVVAHFFFDCLTQRELDSLVTRIARGVRADALWLVSDFRIPDGALRFPARAIVRALYLAFRALTGLRITTLPDHAAAFGAAGLIRVAHRYSLGGLLTTELWQRQEYTLPMLPTQRTQRTQRIMQGKARPIEDPLPDPEPASPSLPGPDPGVFHREPGDPPPAPPVPGPAH